MVTHRYRAPRPFIWSGTTTKCHKCGKPIIETDSVFLELQPGSGELRYTEVYYHNRCFLKRKPSGDT